MTLKITQAAQSEVPKYIKDLLKFKATMLIDLKNTIEKCRFNDLPSPYVCFNAMLDALRPLTVIDVAGDHTENQNHL
uniref:Uncharacterized protein n=1 Tax=Romanomermis culicivorax TaxID=13658 RepID=A0A915J345_ROMCU